MDINIVGMSEKFEEMIKVRDELNRFTVRAGVLTAMSGMAMIEKVAPSYGGLIGEIQGSLAHPLLGYSGALIGVVAGGILAVKQRAVINTITAVSAMATNFAAERVQDVLGMTAHNFTADVPETAKDAAFAALGLGVFMVSETRNK